MPDATRGAEQKQGQQREGGGSGCSQAGLALQPDVHTDRARYLHGAPDRLGLGPHKPCELGFTLFPLHRSGHPVQTASTLSKVKSGKSRAGIQTQVTWFWGQCS